MAAEKEQGIRNEEIHLVFRFYDGSKGIYTISHVCVTADDIDTGKGTGVCVFKRGAPP